MNMLIKNVHIIVGNGDTIKDGFIGIDGNKISYVSDKAPEIDFGPDTQVIDAKGAIAMPGLVNAHCHSPMALLRNFANDLPLEEWLFGNIIPAEGKLTPEDVYIGTILGIAEMIKSGVTCFADMYFHMDEVAKAVVYTGIRANLSRGPITSSARGNGMIVDSQAFIDYKNQWHNAADGRIKVSMEIHSVYLFDAEPIENAAKLAKEHNSGIHIHVSETKAEIENSITKYGKNPVKVCEELGVFAVPTIAAHCVHVDDEDMEILKKYNVSPVHNPSSNLKLGSGIAPVQKMLEKGINVCLGTDGAASNNNLNMMEELHLAALLHKGANHDPLATSAKDVIKMATVNGAKALGFEGEVGEIKEGLKADIILIDTNKPHLTPLRDIDTAVVYSAAASDVDTVIVDGKILMQNRKLLTIDEEKLLAEVNSKFNVKL